MTSEPVSSRALMTRASPVFGLTALTGTVLNATAASASRNAGGAVKNARRVVPCGTELAPVAAELELAAGLLEEVMMGWPLA